MRDAALDLLGDALNNALGGPIIMEITDKVRQHYRLTRIKKDVEELLTLDSGTKTKLDAAIDAKKKGVKDALPKSK